MSLIIIQPTPGLTTTERILQLIEESPEGMTVRELSERLNRPVSMVNLCLKVLLDRQLICGRKPSSSQYWVYYPLNQNETKLSLNKLVVFNPLL